MYGSYFIQFPKVHILINRRIQRRTSEITPECFRLFIIVEICRQLFLIIKDNLPQKGWESIFPIKLGYLTYSNMINTQVVGGNLHIFNFGSYQGRRNFDNKGFAAKILGLKGQSLIVSHLEDLQQDCDEGKVIKRYHLRLTLPQINSFKLKFQLEGVVEDDSNIIKLGWEEVSELKQLIVDQSQGK